MDVLIQTSDYIYILELKVNQTAAAALQQIDEKGYAMPFSYIYILELKVNQTAAAALQQIDEKGYAMPFASDPRQLFKIGINFATYTKLIDDWKIA